jgi:hypothetical protein
MDGCDFESTTVGAGILPARILPLDIEPVMSAKNRYRNAFTDHVVVLLGARILLPWDRKLVMSTKNKHV